MIKINFGCGSDIRIGYENFDMYPMDDKVKYLNLNKLPLPFNDGSVDEIILSHVLEHLDVNPYDFMKDIYRILKKNGIVIVSLPVFYNCVTHNRFYHNSGYFAEMTTRDVRVSDEYANDFFKLVSFKRKTKGIKGGLEKLIAFVMDFFYEDYQWVLKKK